MKQQTKLSEKQEHVEEQLARTRTGKEFASADELLRFDAAQTAVPPEVTGRLQKSAAEIRPPAARPWWKNIFGR